MWDIAIFSSQKFGDGDDLGGKNAEIQYYPI